MNYLQRFLPSGVCEPLRKLTHKDTAWRWTGEQQQAFDTIKQLVCEITILQYYQPSEELTLQCDASEEGLGAAIPKMESHLRLQVERYLEQKSTMLRSRKSFWSCSLVWRNFASTHTVVQYKSNLIISHWKVY